MNVPWTLQDMPGLTGRRALVTGVTSGLGQHVVTELARRGAEVVMAARSQPKLASTIAGVEGSVPAARVVPLLVDLADLSSVRRAAAEAASYGPLDLLVNNAGVMATPERRTADGFDLQMGTNHFGHFALTGLLLPQLAAADGGGRVVTVSSHLHRMVRSVPLGDPRMPHRPYRKWVAYSHSKLANLLFMFELDRRARAAGLPLVSTAAHPGWAATGLQSTGIHMDGPRAEGAILVGVTRLVGQSSGQGALPVLMAATMPELPGGSFVGPGGIGEMRGLPTLVGTSRAARDEQMAARLWQVSEAATGVRYP